MNENERNLALNDPIAAYKMQKSRKLAISWGEKMMGEDFAGDDTKGNAFRHAFWSATAVQMMGEEKTKVFTDAHEIDPETPSAKMDLFNNERGIEIGNLYMSQMEKGMAHRNLGMADYNTFDYYGVTISVTGNHYENLALMVKTAVDNNVLTWLK